MRLPYLLLLTVLTAACIQRSIPPEAGVPQAEVRNTATDPVATSTPTVSSEEPDYPGITLDEQFPPAAYISSLDDNGRENDASFEINGYAVKTREYVPLTLAKDGKVTFQFKKRQDGGYWGTVVGLSSLRGEGHREIYAVVSGPGAVCCTNYSLIDITSDSPRSIFHSEDFGSFRDPMEIFDADGDGVFELMQWDSCFRYFMDDCGACSPEPRAYFKYDRASRTYRPAAGIQQDFVRKRMSETERSIAETYRDIQQTNDEVKLLELQHDLDRTVLNHAVQLLHLGEEAKAWKLFRRFGNDPDGSKKREMRKRLAGCKFYQALQRAQIAR